MIAWFSAGGTAMMIDGPWDIKTYDKAGLDYDIAPIPGMEEGKPASWEISGWNLGISSNSKNVDAATKFIKFVCQPEENAIFTDALPSVIEAGKSKKFADPKLQTCIAQLAYACPEITISIKPAIYIAVSGGLQRIFLGEDTTKVANEVNQEIQGLIDKQ